MIEGLFRDESLEIADGQCRLSQTTAIVINPPGIYRGD